MDKNLFNKNYDLHRNDSVGSYNFNRDRWLDPDAKRQCKRPLVVGVYLKLYVSSEEGNSGCSIAS